MVTSGMETGSPNMAGCTKVIAIIFVRIVEAVFARLGEEDDAVAVNGRLDNRQIVGTGTFVTGITGFAERPGALTAGSNRPP